MKETNCINCGAPLHYDETNYGELAKCQYCNTEYHIDRLGRIEEYNVKIKIMGKTIDFYVSEMKIQPICSTSRNIAGNLIRRKLKDVYELRLISY